MTSPPRALLRPLLTWAALLAALALLGRLSPRLVSPEVLPADDYGHFWAAGRLNLQGQDPYNPSRILALLTPLGRPPPAPGEVLSVMLNPPWALPLVMPLAWLDYPLSRLAWLLLNIAVLLFCARQFWQALEGRPSRRWLAFLLTFTFAPTIVSLQKGQFGPLILLGLALFLRWQAQANKSLAAGAALSLAALKPQLVYLLWPAWLLDCLRRRDWQMPLGLALGLSAGLGLALAFNPAVLAQYQASLGRFPLSAWATPTLGAALRFWLGLENFALQFLPMLIGVAWLALAWRRNGVNWRWEQQLPSLLFACLLTTPYAWTYDLVLLLPGLLRAAHLLSQNPSALALSAGWVAYAALNLLDLLLHRRYDDFWFVWLGPAFWFWSLVVSRPPPPAEKGNP